MALTKFCCCCDLRKGCIVFSWLNLMAIALEIANMASLLQVSAYIFRIPTEKISLDVNVAQIITVTYSSNIIIAEQVIKGCTYIALILGLTKKEHGWYQPWLLIAGIECIIWSLLILIFFIVGCIAPVFFAMLIPVIAIAGLMWYFWFSVYAVYQRDQLKAIQVPSEPYEQLVLNANI